MKMGRFVTQWYILSYAFQWKAHSRYIVFWMNPWTVWWMDFHFGKIHSSRDILRYLCDKPNSAGMVTYYVFFLLILYIWANVKFCAGYYFLYEINHSFTVNTNIWPVFWRPFFPNLVYLRKRNHSFVSDKFTCATHTTIKFNWVILTL